MRVYKRAHDGKFAVGGAQLSKKPKSGKKAKGVIRKPSLTPKQKKAAIKAAKKKARKASAARRAAAIRKARAGNRRKSVNKASASSGKASIAAQLASKKAKSAKRRF